MEDLAGGARMNAAAAVEGEQQCDGTGFRKCGAAPLDLGVNQFSDAEATGLSGAQTEPIAASEVGTICGTALAGSRVIWKTGGRDQQAARLATRT
jgi:hypothetical protein